MKFTYLGQEYVIEFERQKKNIPVPNPLNPSQTRSTHPYTTARVLERTSSEGATPVLYRTFREATVGCWHREPQFSLEKGRVRALRMITKTIPVPMKPLLWEAYHTR